MRPVCPECAEACAQVAQRWLIHTSFALEIAAAIRARGDSAGGGRESVEEILARKAAAWALVDETRAEVATLGQEIARLRARDDRVRALVAECEALLPPDASSRSTWQALRAALNAMEEKP